VFPQRGDRQTNWFCLTRSGSLYSFGRIEEATGPHRSIDGGQSKEKKKEEIIFEVKKGTIRFFSPSVLQLLKDAEAGGCRQDAKIAYETFLTRKTRGTRLDFLKEKFSFVARQNQQR
jgi:hypothetical protein